MSGHTEGLSILELDRIDVVFGNIKHMPKYDTLPEEFQREHGPYCRAVQMWFFQGAKGIPGGIVIDGVTFKARPGIDQTKALAAIKAVLASFEPKHEHKIAACGFMLSQWFEIEAARVAALAKSEATGR